MTDLSARFHALHQGSSPLLICNAWDAGSARLMRNLGALAVATTSAGVAWTHGYVDGNALPCDLLVATAAGIARAVDVPVSIDMEAGYSDDPAAVAALAARLVDVGVVGINIEDGAGSPDLLAAKIAAIRAAVGPDLFINARCDVYLRPLTAPDARVSEALRRAALYAGAGASGLFTPGVTDKAEIAALAAGTHMPLNIMARPTLAPLSELVPLGVKRLSAGSALPEHLWGRAAQLAGAFLADGLSGPICADPMPYGAVNALMAGPTV